MCYASYNSVSYSLLTDLETIAMAAIGLSEYLTPVSIKPLIMSDIYYMGRGTSSISTIYIAPVNSEDPGMLENGWKLMHGTTQNCPQLQVQLH